ncbi:MAG: hypothetical protein AVDCRST_MAG68-5624 [uncultured Gemmatimonadetes bacterium]|uniref:Uncharacterized protein n=1 Tax=uncultured Gemmatimonadota bacterium TaxID=203437 RepID=A0A6J4MY30_9BACT|nr:MAG: hypothetical protein AVDCRST_MAG68-5624 [uncultured Gemmatimonadota bacterium]
MMTRKPRPFLAALSMVALLAAGCAEIVKPQYRFSEVRVRTTDQWEVGIEGSTVVLYTGSREMGRGVTNVLGEYVFREVASGSYGVGINPPRNYGVGAGQVAYVDTLHIEQGSRREVSFILYYTGNNK